MADETRIPNDETTIDDRYVRRGEVVARADAAATLPADRTRSTTAPDDPEQARAEIEQTRARMSETIDEIEDALLRKKERIQERLDVLAPVRERPFPAIGLAFGAGLVLGLLTGGDEEDEEDYRVRGTGTSDAHERAEMWEHRARRLLRIAREQERELERLSGTAIRADDQFEAPGGGEAQARLNSLRDRVVSGLTDYLASAIKGMVTPAGSRS